MRRIKLDYAVLGGSGPTAYTFFESIHRINRTENGMLLIEKNEILGAYKKGTKVVNGIIPKLPRITSSQLDVYKEILEMKKHCESDMVSYFSAKHSPYIGDSEHGFRYCRSRQEYEILESLPGLKGVNNKSTYTELIKGIRNQLNISCDAGLIFPYDERIWNIGGYLDIAIEKVNPNLVYSIDRFEYMGGDNESVSLVCEDENGDLFEIEVNRLYVCMGLGNMHFEKLVRNIHEGGSTMYYFKLLSYFKCIYESEIPLPEYLSSIILPEYGINITNESSNRNGLLYDTNSGFVSDYDLSNEYIAQELKRHRNIIFDKYPKVQMGKEKDYMCTMFVDEKAYEDEISRHFRFIFSYSTSKNILYINLPYFTGIASAVHNLAGDLNNLRYDNK